MAHFCLPKLDHHQLKLLTDCPVDDRRLLAKTGQEPVLLMSGGAAVKLAPITDLHFDTVDPLIFEGLLALQSHRLAL